MPLKVTRPVLSLLRREYERLLPRECCGILTGDGEAISGAIPAANLHPRPQTHFEIDPQALIDAHRAARGDGPQVVGYYHSHPSGPAEPSATDRAMAAGDGKVWAIVGKDDTTFWRDDESGFCALPYTPADS